MDAFDNPYLITPIVVFIIAQILKYMIAAIKGDYNINKLISIEGSPASQVAAAVSLVPVALAVDGASSPGLGFAVVIAGLVLFYQFLVVNKLDKLMPEKTVNEDEQKSVVSTTAATWWGALTGLVFGFLLTVTYWKDDIEGLSEKPSDSESQIYIFVFIGIIILAEILVSFTRRKGIKKLPTSRKLKRTFRLTLTLPATIGLLFALLQNQTRNATLTDRFFTTLAFVVIPILSIWAYFAVYKKAPAHLKEEKKHFAQEQKKHKTHKKKKKKNKKRR